MIGKMLCKDDECNGDVGNGDGADIAADRAPSAGVKGPVKAVRKVNSGSHCISLKREKSMI